MSANLLFVQLLNGLQYGVLLFLLAAGLTLVFGIMSFVNLAHGSLYMVAPMPRRSPMARPGRSHWPCLLPWEPRSWWGCCWK